MELTRDNIERVEDEQNLYPGLLDLSGKDIVELGCGTAVHTRILAGTDATRTVIAFDVDNVQIERHQQRCALPNVEFRRGGAESIALADECADIVCLFKSLHHVPVAALDSALAEIARILRPCGLAYVSEPIFAGTFNDIIRLFHDEQAVRAAAFAALRRAVRSGMFELVEEIFFLTPSHFRDFSDFEQRIIGATHTRHHLSAETYARVKTLFAKHMTAGGATFQIPMRVDLLRKPAAACSPT